jgi:hypothetical protein
VLEHQHLLQVEQLALLQHLLQVEQLALLQHLPLVQVQQLALLLLMGPQLLVVSNLSLPLLLEPEEIVEQGELVVEHSHRHLQELPALPHLEELLELQLLRHQQHLVLCWPQDQLPVQLLCHALGHGALRHGPLQALLPWVSHANWQPHVWVYLVQN